VVEQPHIFWVILMKAKIVEYRRTNVLEKVRTVGANYLTVWQLDDGRKYRIYTAEEGGEWTWRFAEKRMKMQDKIGTEVEVEGK
jgi:hypothetical protein